MVSSQEQVMGIPVRSHVKHGCFACAPLRRQIAALEAELRQRTEREQEHAEQLARLFAGKGQTS